MYDVVVIGGGPGGYVCAIRAAQNGLKVACVDARSSLGGTCLNEGCIPSKALLESSGLFAKAKKSFSDHGINCSPTLDFTKMMERKNTIIRNLSSGIDMLLKKNKIDKITGFASFVDKNNIIVKSESGETKVNAKNFVIATGSVVSKFPNVEFDEEVIISSKGALEMKKVPEKMIVIGGGVIGMELGSVYSNLGSNVTVIEYADKIIPTFDEDICIAAEKIFVKNGIEIIKSSKVANITKLAKGVKIDFENISTGEKKSIESNVVLISTGRKPYHDGLKIEAAANTKQDSRGFLLVNDKYQISDNIYAIGDVIPGPMLAHKSEEEGVAVADIIAGKHAHINYNAIPSVVYTSPEIASVGFSESELKIKGIGYKIGKFSFAANSRARAVSSEDGFVKIIACEKTDRILGCQIIGKDAGSLIHEVSVLIEFSASSEDLAMCCHAHPTLNEAVKEAALAVSKKAIHS